jgi:hypothetical protein
MAHLRENDKMNVPKKIERARALVIQLIKRGYTPDDARRVAAMQYGINETSL